MDKKKSFVIYDNWGELIANLPDEMAGELIKGVIAHALKGEESTSDNPAINAMMAMIIKKIDEDAEAYREVCNQRSEARKRKTADESATNENKCKQMSSNENKCKQMSSNADDTDTDNDTDLKEKGTNVPKKKTAARFVPPTVDEVRAYCKERNNNVDATVFIDFYASKGWMVGKNKMTDWKASVRTWERSNETRRGKPGFSDMMRQDYGDINELEKELGVI